MIKIHPEGIPMSIGPEALTRTDTNKRAVKTEGTGVENLKILFRAAKTVVAMAVEGQATNPPEGEIVRKRRRDSVIREVSRFKEKFETLLKQGHTERELCQILGITTETLQQIFDSYKPLLTAKQQGARKK